MSRDLTGPWHPTAATLSGRALDVDEMQVAHLEFDADRYVIFDRAGASVDRGRYALDCRVKPWALDLHGDAGAGLGKCLRAICELHDDRFGAKSLTMSYTLDGGERPLSFTEADRPCQSPEKDRLVIKLVFKRLSAS